MTKNPIWREKLESVLDTYDGLIRDKPGEINDASDRDHIQRRLGSFISACGRRGRSADFDTAVRDGLAARNLYMYPILDRPIPSDTWLRVSRDPVPEPEYRFAREQDLQKFLEAQPASFKILSGLDLVAPQHQLPDGRRIDLLFLDKRTNEYVAVELKHAEAGDGAASQLLGYMIQLREQRADREGRGVRGVLIVGSVSREQLSTFAMMATETNIEVVQYRLEVVAETLLPTADGDTSISGQSD